MSSYTRSEFAANDALISGATIRDDWRQVLARRDAKRATARTMRHSPVPMFATMLQSIGAMAVSLISYF